MHVVLCSGCSRPIGVSQSEQPLRNAVYCEQACAAQPPITEYELRDDLMVELSRAGRSDQAIADLFDLSRSRVQRIVSKRTVAPQVASA